MVDGPVQEQPGGDFASTLQLIEKRNPVLACQPTGAGLHPNEHSVSHVVMTLTTAPGVGTTQLARC
jgi:hypothetical protein